MKEILLCAMDVRALADPKLYAAACAAVSETRRAKAARLRSDGAQRRSIGAGLLLRLLLREAGLADAEMTVSTEESGKPYLADRPDVHFSLSHSGSFALCAVSERTVGCDIEEIGEIDLRVAERYFAAAECADILSEPAAEARQERFFRYWTLKESYLKARGTGLRLPLREAEFTLDGENAPRLLSHGGFAFREYGCPAGYRCALCAEGESVDALLRLTSAEECL